MDAWISFTGHSSVNSSEEVVAGFVVACRQSGSVRGKTRSTMIFREKNVEMISHLETHTRKV